MDTKTMTRTALCISVGLFLSRIKIFHMPLGGSITVCSNLFFVLPGYWFGLKVGIVSASIAGFMKFIMGPVFVHPVQFFLDYFLGFLSLGLAQANPFNRRSLPNSFLFCMTLKFLCSFASGLTFFQYYIPRNFSPFLYCLLYNLFYIGVESIITMLMISLPSFKNMMKYFSVNEE